MRKLLKQFLFLFLLQLPAWSVAAVPYTFSSISTSEGLSHKTVNCVLQDSRGFVWIGTSDGLNRFDGYSIKKYYETKGDSLSLLNNNVMAMAEDLEGNLWLATGGGFCCYSPFRESFTAIPTTPRQTGQLAEDLCVDEAGGVWGLVNTNMIINLNPRGKKAALLIPLDSIIGGGTPLYNKRVTSFEGYLWVFSSRGIVRFDPTSNKALLIQSPTVFTSPRAIRKGGAGELFIVDWNRDIHVLNTKSLRIDIFKNQYIRNKNEASVGITDALKDSDGSLWILKFPGLCKISGKGVPEFFNMSTGYERDYDKMVYFNAMLDRDGNMWLGTQDEGVIVVMSRSGNMFNHISVNNQSSRYLQASGFMVDGDMTIVCTHAGSYLRNKDGDFFSPISGGVAYAVSKYNANEYAVFEQNKVFALNAKTNSKRTILETTNLHNGMVDSRGVVWVTHWEQGMDGYDPVTKKKYHIDVDKDDKSFNVVFALVEDPDGSFWLGTFGAGLQRIINPHSSSPTVEQYTANGGDSSLSNNFITSVFDDGNNSLWIGTNGGGLNRFDKKRRTFEHYTTSQGLRSNVIQAITSDEKGNIWFASNIITMFDIEERTFTHYDRGDGVTSRFFTCHAQRAADGTLFFGDNRGILSFNPSRFAGKKPAPVPIITAIRLFGKEISPHDKHEDMVTLNTSIGYADTMELPHSMNSISLEFASVLQPNSMSISYSFMMKGVDEQWTYTKYTERQAIYASLPYGRYTFVVRASTGNNVWSEPRQLHIIISPPWWKTLWFKIILALVLTMVIVLIFYVYTLNLKRRNARLEQLVARRTEELLEANTKLKDERMVVEMKNEHLNDVLLSKERLINIIAHDFKGPLNGILGYAQLVQTHASSRRYDKIDEFIGNIASSARSLVKQMVAMLDWTQAEYENLHPKPVEINPQALLEDAVSLVKAMAEQKNISIEILNESSFNIVVDSRMGSMVFRNLLSNAIKFTHGGGSVTVLIQDNGDDIAISFIDNGVGMSKDLIRAIEMGHDQVESMPGTNNEAGTGFGLRMSRLFVEKNRGGLSITSAERQGTVVVVTLPRGAKNSLTQAIPTIEEEQQERVEPKTEVRSSKHIVLVVDDDNEQVNMTRDSLGASCDVVEANDGKEGLRIALQVMPDVIISDIQMPGTSGIELCESLKKNRKTAHIPVLVVSSFADEETKNRAFAAGANDYIEKPFNPFQLLKKVEALLVLKQKIGEKTKQDVAVELYPDMPNEYEHEIVKKVNAFVDSNINVEKLNVNMIAQELNISRTQLWRVYKSRTGQMLSEYIQERKLQKAFAMLMTQKYRIAEIAYELGYTEPRYFSKWFLKETGMTPTQYTEKLTRDK